MPGLQSTQILRVVQDAPCRRSPGVQSRRRRPAQRGMALMLTTLMLMGITLIILATATLTDTSGRIADRGAQKTEATLLAEAGMNSFYDTIRSTMIANNGVSYPAAPATPTTLSTTMGGVIRTVGTYTAQYVGTPTTTTASINLGTQTQTTWTFTILGIGTSQNGLSTSQVQSTYTATIIQNNLGLNASATAALGPGALQSATTINFRTDGGVRVYDNANLNAANIIANGGIGWSPYSQSRSNANPNILSTQGDFQVPNTPSTAYAYTTSPTTGLYKSAGNSIFNSLTNSIVSLSAPETFPSTTQVSTWQSNWITAAQSTNNVSTGSVSASSVTPNASNPGQGEHRITAPAYINGNLNVDSNQLYLQPNSDATKSNVVYVNGNVNNAALLYNRGVVLVVAGQYNETSTSAQYALQTQFSPYSSMTALYGATALVALQAAPTAVNMITSSSSGPGLVFTPNGGITIQGNNEIDGVLISGGTGAAGGINIYPQNGNSFVVKYHSEAVVGRIDFNLSVSTGGAIIQAFTPTRMKQWLQLQ